jgi:hypothetical protein
MTTTRWDKPARPLLLDIDESQINQLIILRKRNPYVDEEYEEYIQRKRLADFLGIDFLDFDGLDYDALQEGIKDIWVTELDQTDYMLQDVLHDILDQLNQALYNMFRDELMRQNKQFFVDDAIKYGFDPETGITLEKEDGKWVVQRRDPITNSYFKLRLDRGNDYSINMKQGEWEIYDYKLGIDGGNRIDIEQ